MELVSYEVPWKPITLAPLGDIQWAGRKAEIAWEPLKRHIDKALARDAWFIGMGDYIDFMSPSNRQRLASANLYDTALNTVDDKALELVHTLYEALLKPTTGRWLGLLEGHHFSQLSTGSTTDQKLCELLKARFLGTAALVEIVFVYSGRPTGHARTFVVWAHHGFGGGRSAHAPILKLETLSAYWDADLFLMGHMTKRGYAPINRVRGHFRAKPPRLEHREIHLVGTGGWLKGYAEHRRQGKVPRGNYVEVSGMNPVALGAPLIRIEPHQARVGDSRAFAPRVEVVA